MAIPSDLSTVGHLFQPGAPTHYSYSRLMSWFFPPILQRRVFIVQRTKLNIVHDA